MLVLVQQKQNSLQQHTVQQSNLLAVLHQLYQYFWLLSWLGSHFLWQLINSLQINAVCSILECFVDVWEEGLDVLAPAQKLYSKVNGIFPVGLGTVIVALDDVFESHVHDLLEDVGRENLGFDGFQELLKGFFSDKEFLFPEGVDGPAYGAKKFLSRWWGYLVEGFEGKFVSHVLYG